MMWELDAYDDTYSDWEDTTESGWTVSNRDNTSTEFGNNDTDAESPPRTLFTPQLPTSAHSIAITLMLPIPPFG